MAWLPLLKSLIGLALALLSWAARRGSIAPERAETARLHLEEAVHAVDLARDARDRLERDLLRHPDRLRADDGHRRD